MNKKLFIRLFGLAFLGAVVALFSPYLDGKPGLEVFQGALNYLVYEHADNRLFLIMIGPAVWLPLTLLFFYKNARSNNVESSLDLYINSFLLFLGASIYILPFSIYYEAIFGFGYWLLLSCMTLMYLSLIGVQMKKNESTHKNKG